MLAAHGFEPRCDPSGTIVLQNCPFHQIATRFTELICGMNHSLLSAAIESLGRTGLEARLEPEEGSCCVRLRSRSAGPLYREDILTLVLRRCDRERAHDSRRASWTGEWTDGRWPRGPERWPGRRRWGCCRRPSGRARTTPSTPTTPSLYDRLGGFFPIAAVVDRFSDAIIVNPKLNENPALRGEVNETHTRLASSA